MSDDDAGKWSVAVGPHGHRVRVRERRRGGNVYLYSYDPDMGGNRKTSLGFPVRGADGELIDDAVEEAKAEAVKACNALIRGDVPGDDEPDPVTVGELFEVFRREYIRPEMEDHHREDTLRELELIERYLGPDTEVDTIGVREWNALKRDRMSGAVDGRGRRVRDEDDRRERSARTAQKTLKVLRHACRFGARYRDGDGNFLLPDGDPTRGLELPTSKDPARPMCSDALLAAMLDAADDHTVGQGDGGDRSYLREMIVVAAGTGARLGSLLALRWSDWDPDGATHGTLTWRGDAQKNGETRTTPVPKSVRGAIRRHRQRYPGVAEAPMWPAPRSDGRLSKDVAVEWIQDVEKAARGHHVDRFGWHALRRRWANKMKDRSPVDAAHLGGWAGPHVMQTVYQRATVDDMDRTLDAGDPGRVSEAAEAAV